MSFSQHDLDIKETTEVKKKKALTLQCMGKYGVTNAKLKHPVNTIKCCIAIFCFSKC